MGEGMKEKLNRFLQSRYGVDELSKMGFTLSVILSLVNLRLENTYLSFVITLIFLYFGFYRPLSKNRGQRMMERRKYLEITKPLRDFFEKSKVRAEGRKTHRYFACPNCKRDLKVPRGKGKIKITCPHCRHQFIKKT